MQKLIVVGGGAAGFFGAITAKTYAPDLEVVILEKTDKLLAKVRISGGGRCNVTHNAFEVSDLMRGYPRGKKLLQKAFHHFGPKAMVDWLKQRGVVLKAEADGRMFPVSDSSQTIIDCFLAECRRLNIKIITKVKVTSFLVINNKIASIDTNLGELNADFILIATGGFPTLQQYEIFDKLPLKVQKPIPSLFTFNIEHHPLSELMGISMPHVQVKIAGTKHKFEGPILITHWGFSGPCVLKLSSFAAEILAEKKYHFQVIINWIPNFDTTEMQFQWKSVRAKKSKITNVNPFQMPNRLWEALVVKVLKSSDYFWNTMPTHIEQKLISALQEDIYSVKGKTTYKEEFVTCGGFDTQAFNPTTLQHQSIANLYAAGEILNADGITGGYNFQQAWTTAWLAGKNIANRINE